MQDIDNTTIGAVFRKAAEKYGSNPLLMVPPAAHRGYHRDGYQISFGEAARQIDDRIAALAQAGYGHGHRIAVLLENRPEHMLYKLALATLGISWVPINPDYRPAEIAYLLSDSGADLAITVPEREDQLRAGLAESGCELPIHVFERMESSLPDARRPAPDAGPPGPATECSLIYTSGTTGRPKGCIIGHEYELMMGKWYTSRGGLLDYGEGAERIYNPLPLFHVNAGIVSFMGAMMSGNCQIQPERFSRTSWWPDVRESGATVIHYLGVIAPVLMSEPPSDLDRQHIVKFGFGAGIEPSIHAAFEQRFGFPMIEVWGMTEMCRCLGDYEEPRRIDTRAIGRAVDTLEVRVVDQNDQDVPVDTPGEMLVRYSAETPRKGAFSGYLNKPEETEAAWRGGWFHTGDTVTRDASGRLYFVDRAKNIIRRSGENIAAAEVEACLLAHEGVARTAVIAVEDEVREEEVMACVVATDGTAPSPASARVLFDFAYERLAYYKAPGWIVFVDDLPVTGTQKVQKHKLFPDGEDPRTLPTAHDFRVLKKR